VISAPARWLTLVCFTLLVGCSLPPLRGRSSSYALTNTVDTRLGQAVAPRVADHPSESGIHALRTGRDAFAARVLLAGAAQRSIDAQYYIWHADVTGILLFEAIWQAADRGVRVRLLLDDHSTEGLDPTLAALAAHKNIQVRLFNPLRHRRARWLNYALDFRRVNHRMHNKSFTIDNQVAVIGGRNIGDEYFQASAKDEFEDLDVIAIGPAVSQISNEFDTYWNSAEAYPAQLLLHQSAAPSTAALLADFTEVHDQSAAISYLDAVSQTGLIKNLDAGRLTMDWSGARLVYDDPQKATDGNHREQNLLLSRLLAITSAPRTQFDLVSPYFVPGKEGKRRLTNLATNGVRVRILTNSLESTDATVVHGGYRKYRKSLLRAGVKLYELERGSRPSASAERKARQEDHVHYSATGLHAKTFQIDGRSIFVGSFNFDPRSARLNTEMGLLIDNSVLASRLSDFFEQQVPLQAYALRLTDHGHIEWIDSSPQGPRIYEHDPRTSIWRRAEVRIYSILPIDWLL
jgi:putative cardiolipin synthase